MADLQKNNDIKKIRLEYENKLKNKNEEIFKLHNKISLLLNKIEYLENKINEIASNEIKQNNNKSINEKNNEYIISKTLRVNNTSNIFSNKDMNKSVNVVHSRTKKKKIFSKNFTSSFIKQSNNSKETYFIKKINNNTFGESVNNFIFNINESSSNRSNIYNILDKFSSNKTITSEKIKIQKKLEEYHELIDKKLNRLINKGNYCPSTNSVKTIGIRLKLYNKEGRLISNNLKKNYESVYEILTNRIKYTSNRSQRNINRKNI